jgi:hypothetical protein
MEAQHQKVATSPGHSGAISENNFAEEKLSCNNFCKLR